MRAFTVEHGQHFDKIISVRPTNVNARCSSTKETMKLFRPDLENPGPDDLAVAAKFMHILPVGSVEPEAFGDAVLFLASDESRYITDFQ